MKPICGTTKGKDILDTFKNFEEREIDIKKIISVTTDGTPAMMGQHRGSVIFVEQKIRHPVMKLHCIIHEENLSAKISNSALNTLSAARILQRLLAGAGRFSLVCSLVPGAFRVYA